MRTHAALLVAVAIVVMAPGCRRSVRGTGGTATISPARAERPETPRKEVIQVRGVYLTGWSAGRKVKMRNIVALLRKTGMNAVVIDVKDSDGATTFPMDTKWARQIEAKRGKIREIEHYRYGQRAANIDWTMDLLRQNNIYPIARIAVFADDILPRVRPDLAAKTASGGVWENRKREAWLNPYQREAWEYNVAVAIEAAKRGFKEIQWDYVRFPSDGKMGAVRYPGKTKQAPAEVIAAFLAYARKKLEPYGVVMSADIFGLTGLARHDMGIGQILRKIAENVDYICPMVYPSHFAKGEYGIANPDKQPYRIVQVSLRDALSRVKGTQCKVRPWLQNFSLPDRGRYGGSRYTATQIRAQIKAARDNGISEFLMWDPLNRFNHLAEALTTLDAPPVGPRPAAAKRTGG